MEWQRSKAGAEKLDSNPTRNMASWTMKKRKGREEGHVEFRFRKHEGAVHIHPTSWMDGWMDGCHPCRDLEYESKRVHIGVLWISTF